MREIPFRTAGKDGQALSVSPALAPAVIQKSPSVVALSRVASGELALPVSPPAAGRGCKEVKVSSLGGCPASCPDAHRPTHGHRHVRNWAISQICVMAPRRKKFLRRGSIFLFDQ